MTKSPERSRAELEAEERFDRAIESSREVLERLSDEALAEHRAAKTESLDPKSG